MTYVIEIRRDPMDIRRRYDALNVKELLLEELLHPLPLNLWNQ